MTLPDTMRAMVTMGHGDMDQLVFHENWPRPDPARGEVLIRVRACGLNNTDVNTRVGWYSKTVTAATSGDAYEKVGDEDPSWGGAPVSFPRIQGADVCGEIVAVGEGVDPAITCFAGEDYNGYFNDECAIGEPLHKDDFTQAASLLAGASGKTGKITVDLVQYLNRILRITRTTDMSTATKQTLPALIRDCGEANATSFPAESGKCKIKKAGKGLPAPADELFVKFNSARFDGEPWRDQRVTLLQEEGGSWNVVSGFHMNDWLLFVNGDVPTAKQKQVEGMDIDGFVRAASDALRAVEFVHNYAIPEDLWKIYLNKQE